MSDWRDRCRRSLALSGNHVRACLPDTDRQFTTVNGQPAHGGSLDGPGPVIAGGMVYVSSGYGQFGGMEGNVLLAFSVDGH